jgi:hypothetical protein
MTMALDDRDYMRDRERKRSQAGEKSHYYDPKQFRTPRGNEPGDHDRHPAAGNGWFSVLVRTAVICLAVYGGMTALQQIHTWAERKQRPPESPPVQQYLPLPKEVAWARYFQPQAYCAYATDQALEHCRRDRAAARRRFEELYAQGKL